MQYGYFKIYLLNWIPLIQHKIDSIYSSNKRFIEIFTHTNKQWFLTPIGSHKLSNSDSHINRQTITWTWIWIWTWTWTCAFCYTHNHHYELMTDYYVMYCYDVVVLIIVVHRGQNTHSAILMYSLFSCPGNTSFMYAITVYTHE